MSARASGPRRRPAPPHVQEKARRAQAKQKPPPPAPRRRAERKPGR